MPKRQHQKQETPQKEYTYEELMNLNRRKKPKWSNGWEWVGKPHIGKTYINADRIQAPRKFYHCIKHPSGDVLYPRDCVLLRADKSKPDTDCPPYVAKIIRLWENPEDGEMMFTMYWYYAPEDTHRGRSPEYGEKELLASNHVDVNSVASIEDKCYVLTYNEYCRYRKEVCKPKDAIPLNVVPPRSPSRSSRSKSRGNPPKNTSPEVVFFCRRLYDIRKRRIFKRPKY